MPTRERKRSTVAAELAALLDVGDNRAAAARARQVLSDGARSTSDHEAARAALGRVKPERAAAMAAAGGFVLLAVAALLGLLRT